MTPKLFDSVQLVNEAFNYLLPYLTTVFTRCPMCSIAQAYDYNPCGGSDVHGNEPLTNKVYTTSTPARRMHGK